MIVTRIPFEQVPQFSKKDVGYATQAPELRPFYKYPPKLAAFAEVIQDKQQTESPRATLVDVLEEQYQSLPKSAALQDNIAALAENGTFTIVTAHQPSLFTGPLYFIYKIASTIHLCRQLNKADAAHTFVPVFITGGEDHDFAEINHAHIFNHTVVWENEENGAVGQMKTDSLAPALAQVKEILGSSPNADEAYRILEEAYTQNKTYGAATLQLVNSLFGSYGLVILNMNHPKLKRHFIPYMKKELLEQPSRQFVEEAKQELEAAGFSGQAYAREINLFYLRDQIRERIVLEGDTYLVLNTDYSFTQDQLLTELEAHPEFFSPNVVLRPLYQEVILPNLAYIGGGGEIAYWLERKEQFAHFGVNFPMLIRRNSVLWIDKGSAKKMDKLGLSINDLFVETEALIKRYVKENTDNELSLREEKKAISEIFAGIVQRTQEIDPTLVKTVKAENAKQLNGLDQLEGRLMKAEKSRQEISVQQIRSLQEKLFPGNNLQERHDNFLQFYIRHGQAFIEILLEHLDPLEAGLVVVVEDR